VTEAAARVAPEFAVALPTEQSQLLVADCLVSGFLSPARPERSLRGAACGVGDRLPRGYVPEVIGAVVEY